MWREEEGKDDLTPGVAVLVLDDLVGHILEVLLGGGIVESATNQTLGGEEGVLRVGDG